MVIQQTHFIGVPVPDSLAETLQGCRDWMHDSYGCRSGYGTPFHITLVPPFHLDSRYADDNVRRAAEEAASSWRQEGGRLCCTVDGFGTFSGRTVFAHIGHDQLWTDLRDCVFASLMKECPGTARKDMRPFTPHITVANRDIPAGAAEAALGRFMQAGLCTSFPAGSLVVYRRSGGSWTEDFTASLI